MHNVKYKVTATY